MTANDQHPIQLNLSLRRGDFHLRIDTQLPGKGITAVFGPSGCGKTSLLRAIAGLEDEALDPQHTRIQVGGQCWFSAKQRLPTHKRNVGYVFQEASLFDHLSVAGNLSFGQKRNPDAGIRQDDIVQLLDIEHLLSRSTTHLSGGERQRVAIARALLASPKLLLMDEPLAALDQARKREILPYLERLQQCLAIPIIYVSHALDEIVQLADHLLLLDAGQITGQGSLAALLIQHPLLSQREDAFSLLQGKVSDINQQDQLIHVQLGNNRLRLAGTHAEADQILRLRIYARDVSLCLDYPQRTSILNILPVQILAIEDAPHGQSLVHLDLEGQGLLARISRSSVERLALNAGQTVYAQIKTAALERRESD